MFTHQAKTGVAAYETLSGPIQGKIFDSLMEKVDIKKGFKIIDIGCGTGNNSFKLSKTVGDEGIVVAIDPIKERIKKAKEVYGSSSNLCFKEGCAKESWKFGTDFDLAASSTVFHWVPEHKRKEAFEGIYQSLKPDSLFVFNAARLHNSSFVFILEKISCYRQFLENTFPLSKEDAERILAEVGFQDVNVREVDICIPFPNLDDYLRWIACSLHVNNYTQILEELRELWSGEDLTSLYDDKGQILHKHEFIFVFCRK